MRPRSVPFNGKFHSYSQVSSQDKIKGEYTRKLRHNLLSHFFDGLNYGLSVAKPKNNGLLRKKNTKGGDSRGKRNQDEEN